MANQPTKYRKFVVGAASAALVASAVAPVAFAAEFTDVKDNNSHKAAIDALSDAGVISGYPDGTFQPNQTLTRSDVVKLMGKWLVAEGYKVPTDYKTKPRFSDLKTTSNDELLKMSALVYDNGVFVGKPDGSLDAAGDITRENMAIVLVRAFDRVYDVDLVSYVKGQEFKKDVTDLGKAKAEARPAIDVLDFFDITNPAAPEFNPKNTTTRGQFASFLYKTTKVDFDQIGGEVVAPGVASVKAVNATTVEVTMKDKVTNIDSLKFTIDGLTVSNAAVKQSDDKTVVLTTAVQKGAEKYTVKLNDKAIGNFVGISNVVPDKISLNTKSVQGVVGQQVILSADIGQKEAGVAVTFNVKANTNTTLNKDQVFEAVTNAEGIATFSYTQYNAGNDTVTVYPTGNAAVREQGMVYWSNASQLTIKDITEATTLANGSKKVYEINSARNAGGYVFVTFKENLNVTPDKLVKTIMSSGTSAYELNTNGTVNETAPTAYPSKASTGGQSVIPVKLDASGKANLVLTGSNATATPVVYEGKTSATNPVLANYDARYDATARQATATPVTFKVEHALGLTVKAEGSQNAAIYRTVAGNVEMGGREYVVTYNDKDGKAAAKGSTVRVAIPKVGLTKNTAGTATGLYLFDKEGTAIAKSIAEDSSNVYYDVTLEEAGKATFTLSSANANDYAAPVVFIDTNAAGLDANDFQTTAEVTYFVNTVNYAASLKTKNAAGKEVTSLRANETAYVEYQLVDQNGKPRSFDVATTVSFQVTAGTGSITASTTTIAPGETKTVTAPIAANATTVNIPVTATSASAGSSATVTASSSTAAGVVLSVTTPGSVTVTFGSAVSKLPAAAEGAATINPTKEEITIAPFEAESYSNASFLDINGQSLTKDSFETYFTNNTDITVKATKASDGTYVFQITAGTTNADAAQTALTNAVSSIPAPAVLALKTAASRQALTDAQALPQGTTAEKLAKAAAINAAVAGLKNEATSASLTSEPILSNNFGISPAAAAKVDSKTISSFDFTGNNQTFDINGETITLDTDYTNIAGVVTAINTQKGVSNADITATANGSDKVTLTSTSTGVTAEIAITGGDDSVFVASTTNGTAAVDNSVQFTATDGTSTALVNLNADYTNIAGTVAAIDTQLGSTTIGATVDGTNKVKLTNSVTGASSTITLGLPGASTLFNTLTATGTAQQQ